MLSDSERQLLLGQYLGAVQPPVRVEALRCGVRPADEVTRATLRFARKQPSGTLVLWDNHLVFLAHKALSIGAVLLLIVGLLVFIAACTALSLSSGKELIFIPAAGGLGCVFLIGWLSKRKLNISDLGRVERAASHKASWMIALQDIERVDAIPASGYLGCTSLWILYHDTQQAKAQVVATPQPGASGSNRDFPAGAWGQDILKRFQQAR